MWVCLRLEYAENSFSDGQCDEPSFLGVPYFQTPPADTYVYTCLYITISILLHEYAYTYTYLQHQLLFANLLGLFAGLLLLQELGLCRLRTVRIRSLPLDSWPPEMGFCRPIVGYLTRGYKKAFGGFHKWGVPPN